MRRIAASGGDGASLQPPFTNAGGTYKTDSGGTSIEFQAGTFTYLTLAGNGGSLVVSGASVNSVTGSGSVW